MVATQTVVFGCGNILLGDDGFGPAVIDALHANKQLPAHVQVMDVGTGIREYLVDYILSPESRPQLIIVLDAVDFKKQPGEIMEIDPSSFPVKKVHDFSLHQFPSVNLLQELQTETGIDVRIVAAQVQCIPDHVAPGLSPAVADAVDRACAKILQMLERYQPSEADAP